MAAPLALRSVVVLSGGVGGARLVHGLDRALPPGALTVVVNTGDDFVHWGLQVCPDLDTVMYTLADLAAVERGWGLADETFHALAGVRAYGGDDWFALSDRDLATHLVRTERLRRGESLTAVTAALCAALGIRARVLPMSDDAAPTLVDTEAHGTLPFQTWFVRHRAPPVRAVRLPHAARATEAVLAALASADLVVLGPSNPYVSIDPILQLPGVRERVFARPVVAVSPIVHGTSVKGPLADMLRDLARVEPSPAAIAAHYAPGLAGLVVESGDEHGLAAVPVLATGTVMRTREDSARLAREVLAFAARLAPAG